MGIVKSIYLKSESDWELMKSEAAKAERSVSDYLIRLARGSLPFKKESFKGPAVSPDDVQVMDLFEKPENTETRKEPVSPKPKDSVKAEKLAKVQLIAPVYPARTFNPQPKSDKKGK